VRERERVREREIADWVYVRESVRRSRLHVNDFPYESAYIYTICCKSDGDTILCSIRISSVYANNTTPHTNCRTNPHTIWFTYLSPRKAKITFSGTGRQK
jgi:hypothetical protein